MFSYQCSHLVTSDTIQGICKQAQQYQDNKDSSTFASVVVLDQIGLTEDSPNLPLNVLHPLLEDRTEGNEYIIKVREEDIKDAGGFYPFVLLLMSFFQ